MAQSTGHIQGLVRALVFCGILRLVTAAARVVPPPLSITPSQQWDGDDGQWSTFTIRVGTPGQQLRVLPGTSASASTTTWVIIDPGCSVVNPTLEDCSSRRGGLFASNRSTSWSTQGLSNGEDGAVYGVPAYEEAFLNRRANASYGFDTVSLGLLGSNTPTLQNQVIAGIATNDFWLGSLGLSPLAFNFSSGDNPETSMLSTLRNQSLIPSRSWAYTAGAIYKSPPVFGSLTLGGFDTTRYAVDKSASFAFGADISRDLLLGLKSITYDTSGAYPLLANSNGIDVFIDSVVPEIWLPRAVCDQFQQTFNLTFNEQAQVYLASDAAHRALVAQNPTFTFTLGPAGGGSGGNVEIAIPYAAFDLDLTRPIVGNSTRWFPLKRAQNATQYTLGRTFLQEAYVIADYERQNFTVAQALFPSTSMRQNLKMIQPPNQTSGMVTSGLSAGAIAGIVVGIVVAIVALLAGLFWFWRRHKKRTQPAPHAEEPTVEGKPEMADTSVQAAKGHARNESAQTWNSDTTLWSPRIVSPMSPELASGNMIDGRHELGAVERAQQLGGRPMSPSDWDPVELPGSKVQRHEKP